MHSKSQRHDTYTGQGDIEVRLTAGKKCAAGWIRSPATILCSAVGANPFRGAYSAIAQRFGGDPPRSSFLPRKAVFFSASLIRHGFGAVTAFRYSEVSREVMTPISLAQGFERIRLEESTTPTNLEERT